jgi:hypothetical protein
VTGFGLDSPLAELYAAGIPLFPIGAVGVSFDTDYETDRGRRNAIGNPVYSWFESFGINVRVYAPACEQNQVAEEICFEDGDGEGVVGFYDFWYGGVEVAD